jgi:hypothetical protein
MSLPARLRLAPSIALVGLGLALGCDQPTGSTMPRSRDRPAKVADPSPPPPAPEAPRQFIVGKRTQDVREVETEKKAGGVVTTPRITAKDPITLQGNAYVTAIGKISIGQIEYAIKLYQAETGEFPKTYDEFMEKIIKANNIALPQLPVYQKYAYDAPNHKLVVMEYPDLR